MYERILPDKWRSSRKQRAKGKKKLRRQNKKQAPIPIPSPRTHTHIHTKVETEQKTWPNTKFKDEGVEFPRPLKVKSSTNQTNFCHNHYTMIEEIEALFQGGKLKRYTSRGNVAVRNTKSRRNLTEKITIKIVLEKSEMTRKTTRSHLLT